MFTTKALIVVFAEPIDEQKAEELLHEIEDLVEDNEVEGHVEHFTELRAKKLMNQDHDRTA